MPLVVPRSIPYYIFVSLLVLAVSLVCLDTTDPLATNSSLDDKEKEIYLVGLKSKNETLLSNSYSRF